MHCNARAHTQRSASVQTSSLLMVSVTDTRWLDRDFSIESISPAIFPLRPLYNHACKRPSTSWNIFNMHFVCIVCDSIDNAAEVNAYRAEREVFPKTLRDIYIFRHVYLKLHLGRQTSLREAILSFHVIFCLAHGQRAMFPLCTRRTWSWSWSWSWLSLSLSLVLLPNVNTDWNSLRINLITPEPRMSS